MAKRQLGSPFEAASDRATNMNHSHIENHYHLMYHLAEDLKISHEEQLSCATESPLYRWLFAC